ncbi:DUF1850 domain-containing protein [Pseudothauera rhizosphaerae]|uniref:DUF1850 domain-containing protein n=1 Tax=Pseudothauera rhizosphaerae TaxID=2565932 RepID=A0A4S4AB84_9RHOO|nr:DUF1850 domain-containing protein [Pseudothauera rhizosphaerae]THF56209.1 DUF1850 domain-containing protein [Pseudothauera rhizosphaerae]
MSGLCLASGLLSAFVGTQAFTLAWTHSIEKVRWEEDWQVRGSALYLAEGRVRGSGAGMEPPEGSRLKNGVWRYPVGRELERLELAHSAYTAGYELCVDGRCKPLHAWLPGLPAAPAQPTAVTLGACPAPGEPAEGQ